MYTLEKPTKMNKSEKRQQQQQRNDIVYMWVLRRSQAQNRKTAANKESECVNEWADKKYQKWKYTLSLAQTHTHTRNAAHNTLTYISVNFVCLFVFFLFLFSLFRFILHSTVDYVLLVLFMNICFFPCRQYWCPFRIVFGSFRLLHCNVRELAIKPILPSHSLSLPPPHFFSRSARIR